MNNLNEAYHYLENIGFEFKDINLKRELLSVELEKDIGSSEISSNQTGIVSLAQDLFSVPTNEADLIKTYRSMALSADVDRILNEIRNEIFVFDVPGTKAIDISFDETKKKDSKLSNSLLEKIRAEYNTIYNVLDFQRKGLEYFDRFFIDGRIFLQKIVDSKKEKDGIKKIIIVDSLKIRKVMKYPSPDKSTGLYDLSCVEESYIYSDSGSFSSHTTSRVISMSKDIIAYADSGVYDVTNNLVLSELWKMIIPYNNMKMMEEALLIYRVVRSPERRVFYVNVGSLSKPKAEQYMQELMNKFKNKLVYNAQTGSIVDRKNVLSMVEDYWMPRRDDGKGTEVQSLPGASSIGSVEDVDLFRKKFLEASNIPPSRFRDDAGSLVFGRTTEIARDEYRFKKFRDRVRNRFIVLFEDILRTQLLLRKVISEEDWDRVRESIQWIYAEDNNFVQWKQAEILNSQIETLAAIDTLVGKYFSKKWALKNVMNKSDEIVDLMIEDANNETQANEETAIPPEDTENP